MTPQQLDELFSTQTVTQSYLSSSPMHRIGTIRFATRDDCNQPSIEVKQGCSLHPKNVIFNPPATIVEWSDGTKTVVKCRDDKFSEEFGYAMAAMRKIYGSRKEFFAQFKDAYRPYLKPNDPKRVKQKAEDQAGDGAQK